MMGDMRELARVEIGDLLEAGVENGKIVLTPKSLVDRHVAEGLEDARAGRTHGPYGKASDAVAALESRTKRSVKNRRP